MENQSISKSKTIVSGHHNTTDMLSGDEKMADYEQIVK